MSPTDPDDPTEEFWALFGAELDEYLTAIETILAASPVDPARVDELFRAFHSVKGGSAALALRCVETVAHAAEDVLHLVRAGSRTLDTGLVSALLEALDEMRRLQGTAMATRTDQPVNAAVVAKLKSHLTQTPAPAPATPVPAASAPSPQPAPVPMPTAAAPALTIGDADLEALQDATLGLIGAIDAEDPTDPAALLAEAADSAGLGGIAGAARRLAGTGRWGWLDLVLRLRGAETASGRTIGAFALTAALEVPFGDLLLEHAGALRTEPDEPAVWLHASRLLAAMEIEAGVELADLVATRLLRGEDLPDTEALTDLCALIGISASSGMDIPHEEITALRDAWFEVTGFAAAGDASASPPSAGQAHPWPAETLIRMAEEAASGCALTLVLLDLESDPAAVDAVTDRLRAERCLYNRSRLDLGGGMFEYVVAVLGSPDAFAVALAETDPSHACLRSVLVTNSNAAPGREAGVVSTTSAPSPPPVPSPLAGVPAAAPVAPRPVDAMVRVPSAAIDGFMDLIGELRLGLTALSRVLGEDGSPQAVQPTRATREEFRRLDRAVRQLYDGAIALRVVPIGTLFTRLLRPIRDTAVLVGKEVALTTAGEDVQVDKAMIEMLVDPLTHIVRNSVDHGIESPERRLASGKPAAGSIRIRARQTASLAIIDVEDDGAGIDGARVRDKAVGKGLIGTAEAAGLSDADALNLILLPGFSTRDEVTATSGRGVGMDIVVTAIKKLGGRLTIDSRIGAGTRMTIEFPVSAAMQRVLTVETAGQTIAIHERSVREVVEVPSRDLQRVGRRLTLSLRGRFLPVLDLGALLGLRETPSGPLSGNRTVVVADDGDSRIGLIIDRMAVRREVFFKRLHPLIEVNPLIAGAAVVGSGGVMFALDTTALFARAAHWLEPEPAEAAPVTHTPTTHTLIIHPADRREEPCSID
ncbi:chemotaxis protein histidine kinase CheA [Skermanella aerolata]|uniref:chemotaxis protein CheA n=1 Tax=Skermanella aerolata TaxID=393310 RepID=UPI003D24B0A6